MPIVTTMEGVSFVCRRGRLGRPADTPQWGRGHAPIKSRRSALTSGDRHNAWRPTLCRAARTLRARPPPARIPTTATSRCGAQHPDTDPTLIGRYDDGDRWSGAVD